MWAVPRNAPLEDAKLIFCSNWVWMKVCPVKERTYSLLLKLSCLHWLVELKDTQILFTNTDFLLCQVLLWPQQKMQDFPSFWWSVPNVLYFPDLFSKCHFKKVFLITFGFLTPRDGLPKNQEAYEFDQFNSGLPDTLSDNFHQSSGKTAG